MRNIKSIILGLTLAIIILIAFAVGISYLYEDEVSQYMIEELNEFLLTEIEAESINLTLIRKFPQASLELKNVTANSREGYFKQIRGYNTDTLFFAKSIFIQIDLFDLISKKVTINSIHFDQGEINLFVDHLGGPNYIIWNTNKEEKNESKEFSVDLNEVRITRTRLIYFNNSTNVEFKTIIKKVDFQGNFSSKNYLMKMKPSLFVEKLSVDNIDYIKNKDISARLGLDILDNLIKINNSNLTLENLSFVVNGSLEKNNNRKVDLLISGKTLNLNRFIKNLPPKVVHEFPNIIGLKGTATLNLSISGENIKKNIPHVEAVFLLNNAQLYDKEREILLSDVNIDGEFSNGMLNRAESSKILFKAFNAQLQQNSFEGRFELKDFKNPQIKLDMGAGIYFEEIKEIFQIDTIDIMEGYAESQIRYSGSYQELRDFNFSDLFTKDYEVSVQLSNGILKFLNHPLILNEISGNIELKKALYTDSLFFKVNNNDFLLKGRISRLFEFFNEKDVFNINARLYSQKLNLNELSQMFKKEGSADTEGYNFPEKIAMQLRLNIQNFEVGKFYATNIKGNLNYKPKMFSLHEVSFNSMNGNVKAGGVITQKLNNDYMVRSQSKLTNININRLFYSFNNFGQPFISNQNLEGNLTGDVYFSSEFSDKIEIYSETINSEGDITIVNGELNDFEPMMGLSRFIEMEELQSIKFSTLKNFITIKDEKIIIPQMEIESSALNLTGSGVHQFDGNYEYRVNMLLSDILSGKMRKNKRKKQDYENIEEDNQGRMRLYLLVEGDKDKNKVRYDRKTARSQRKEGFKEEKTELKQILNEEYGWYKEDSVKNNEEKSREEFQIDFEENKPKEKGKTDKTESEQKFVIEWEEDTTDI